MRIISLPAGTALSIFAVQVYVFFSPEVPINKEALGITILINLGFITYSLASNYKERQDHIKTFGKTPEETAELIRRQEWIEYLTQASNDNRYKDVLKK